MKKADSGPYVYFYRAHRLDGRGECDYSEWKATEKLEGAEAANSEYPYRIEQPQNISGYNPWRRHKHHSYRTHISQASVNSQIHPAPRTIFELVKVPVRLVEEMTMGQVRVMVENIRDSVLLKLGHKQSYELMETTLDHVPETEAEAEGFYRTGRSTFNHLARQVGRNGGSTNRDTLGAKFAELASRGTAAGSSPIQGATKSQTAIQLHRAAHTRRQRGVDIHKTYLMLRKGWAKAKEEEAPAPVKSEEPKP